MLILSTPLARSCAPSTLPPVCVMAVVLFKDSEPHLLSLTRGQHSGSAPLLGNHAICICGCLFHIFSSSRHFLLNPTARSGDGASLSIALQIKRAQKANLALLVHALPPFLLGLFLPSSSLLPCYQKVPGEAHQCTSSGLSSMLYSRPLKIQPLGHITTLHCFFLAVTLREIWVLVSIQMSIPTDNFHTR